jgi:hypothetical protein
MHGYRLDPQNSAPVDMVGDYDITDVQANGKQSLSTRLLAETWRSLNLCHDAVRMYDMAGVFHSRELSVPKTDIFMLELCTLDQVV